MERFRYAGTTRWLVLTLQVGLLACCVAAVSLWGRTFPMPSPLIRSCLPPPKHWPAAQVREWALHGGTDPGFLAFFTRDPERAIPAGSNIVAPADGLLLSIDHTGDTQHVVIALSYWDVHVQRVPCDGVVESVVDAGETFMDGEGRNQVYLRDKVCPVQKVIRLETRWGQVGIRLITSLSARRLESWVRPRQKVKKGERLGRILMGSTVVLDLPSRLAIRVPVGRRVVAGETILSEGEGD